MDSSATVAASTAAPRGAVQKTFVPATILSGFTDQHHFLTGIISEIGGGGSPKLSADDWGKSPLSDSPKSKRELQTLLHPEMLGRTFQVLALAKKVDPAAPVVGFKFARDPHQTLGV